MCGLVGMAGDLAFKDEITMKRLLVLDVFRGPDSTGLAAVRNTGEIKIAKIASHPMNLFDSGRFKEALDGTKSKAFLGHNRLATRGVINELNAHPYEYDHIVGMHNGTLENTSVKALETLLGEKYPVDSMALIAAIAKVGVKDAVEMCHEGKDSTTGAWALVWYDALEGSINFLRNKHRPLWYAFTKDFKKIVWASEWPMIEAAMRLGLGYEIYMDEEYHRFWQIPADVHYKFDIDVLKQGSNTKPKPMAKMIKGKEPGPVVSTVGPDPFMRDQNGGGSILEMPRGTPSSKTSGRGSGSSTTTSHGTTTYPARVPKIVHLLGDLHNPLGGMISEEKFADLASNGCSWCSADVEWGEQGVLIFDRDNIILCPQCVVGDEDEPGGSNTRIYTKHDLPA